MQKREMTCIRCPLGCALTVTEENGQVTVTGNTCPRGAEYGRDELTDPRRTVTTTVHIAGRKDQMLPVKTAGQIPKGKMMECVQALQAVAVTPPVHIGDTIVSNVVGTGIDIVATGQCE